MDNGASSYRRFIDGDENAIVDIIREYKDGLIFYINGYVRDIHIAEELAEDVFFKLMVKRPHFSPRFTFRAWLYSIGRNLAVDFLRKSKKLLFADAVPDGDCLSEEDPIREYIKNEEKLVLHRTLQKLKSEYREVLWLTFFEGFSNEQTARVMKKNKHQIETLVYRAKKSLRSELEKGGFEYEEL